MRLKPFNEKMPSGLPRKWCKTNFLENGESKLDCTFKLGLGLVVMHVRPQTRLYIQTRTGFGSHAR